MEIYVMIKWFLKIITPKCDLCSKHETIDNMLFSDGVGILAHKKCWELSYKESKNGL
jgi:hypothetical protein